MNPWLKVGILETLNYISYNYLVSYVKYKMHFFLIVFFNRHPAYLPNEYIDLNNTPSIILHANVSSVTNTVVLSKSLP